MQLRCLLLGGGWNGCRSGRLWCHNFSLPYCFPRFSAYTGKVKNIQEMCNAKEKENDSDFCGDKFEYLLNVVRLLPKAHEQGDETDIHKIKADEQ